MSNNYFLKGHTIELRVPTLDDVTNSNWHHWYNDQAISRYNQHGIYPVTLEEEIDIFKKINADKTNLMMSIFISNTSKLIGNITLQSIDHLNKRCKLALTIGEEHNMTAGIEAMGLMTEHAFMKLNIERIEEGTHEDLIDWVRMLSIFGYKKEGIARDYFFKNNKKANKIYYASLKKDFIKSIPLLVSDEIL